MVAAIARDFGRMSGGGLGDGISIVAPIPDPVFSVSALSSLIPEVGTGTYTFTRASTATMRDFEGNIQNCYSGEARFSIARRVVNILKTPNAKSNAINDGVWVANNGDEVIHDAHEYTETTGSNISGIKVAGIYPSDANGRTFTVSFSAYKVSGTSNNYAVRLINNGGTNVNSITLTLSGVLQRFSTTLAVATVGTSIDLLLRSGVVEAGRRIHVEDIQVEDVTYRANKNPSEIVSHGMGDDHGCNADGVKWFSTANGNTVNGSGIVTLAAGADLGSIGYLPAQEKTNLAWPTANLTHANWTKNNVVAAVTTGTIGGGLVLNSIKASGVTDVTHTVSFSVTTLVDDEDIALGVFAKVGTQSHAFIRVSKNGDSAAQFYNLTTGAIGSTIDSAGDILVQTDRIDIHPVTSGGYLCHVVINGAAAGAHTVEFGVSDTDGDVTFAAANTTDVLVSFTGLQIQLDHEIGEYIPTVTGTVTKAADVLGYDIANVPGEELTMVAECEIETACISNCDIIEIGNAGATNPRYTIGGFSQRFEASAVDNTDTIVYRARSEILTAGSHIGGATFTRNQGERFGYVNGVKATNSVIDIDDATTWSPITFRVGCNGEGNGQPDFPVRNVRLYQALTEAELDVLTT